MKRVIAISIIAFGLICVSAFYTSAIAEEPSVFVIGGMQTLSGPAYSVSSDIMVQGGNLAVEEINNGGGISGKKMEMLWEDHKAKGPEAVAAFNKLVSFNRVQAISIGYTAPIMACAPLADRNKVLLINHGAYGPVLAGAGKYLFSLPANELVLIRSMLNYAKKNLNIKTIGLIHVNDDMGISVKDFLKEYCPKAGLTFTGAEAFDLSASDYSVQIGKAKNWNADAIYVSAHRSPALIKQASEKGWNPRWLGASFYNYGEYLSQAGSGFKGALAGAADVSMERNPGLLKVKESWEKKYGKDSWPNSMVGHLGANYDAPYIIKTLIEYGKSKGWDNYWEGEKLRQALLEIKTFDGCMGKITFDPKTGLAYRNLQLFEAVVDPDKPNMLKWKDIGGYTAQQVAEMEN
jgi:branched-chain amino acid transport system substrate-binding protein